MLVHVHAVRETTPHSMATCFEHAHFVTEWCAKHSTLMNALDKMLKSYST